MSVCLSVCLCGDEVGATFVIRGCGMKDFMTSMFNSHLDLFVWIVPVSLYVCV
jgi:hypothetical protein